MVKTRTLLRRALKPTARMLHTHALAVIMLVLGQVETCVAYPPTHFGFAVYASVCIQSASGQNTLIGL